MPRPMRRWLLPVVVLTTGGCFATRSDLRVLQGDLQTVRQESARADSVHRAELARVSRVLSLVADTLGVVSSASQRMRGDVLEDLQAIRQQLIAIQELTGQSQRRIQELRAEMEARAAEAAAAAATPVPPPSGSTGAGTPPVAGGSAPSAGPAQLYQLGQDQLRRGSNATARGAFEELLKSYPNSDLAVDALYGVAESYAAEGNGVAADSAYAKVVERFPRSDKAPTALYKRATALRSVGQTERARVLYQQIVDRYPRSDAALLAQDFLRARP